MDLALLSDEIDIAVIGGGLTGMSCALHALQAGLSVTVFEGRGLADGATGRNGGHAWPEEFESDTFSQIMADDIQDVRALIGSLSQEWQDKIALRETGGLWAVFTEDEKDEINEDVDEAIDDENIFYEEWGMSVVTSDPDLPIDAVAGYISGVAA